MQYLNLLDKIYNGHNPYDGFKPYANQVQWFNDPGATRQIFDSAIDYAKPELIIEVGSFIGESAIFMADIIKHKFPSAVILCIDTFLGGIDHWRSRQNDLCIINGRPTLYEQFLSNVIRSGHSGRILPLTLDSRNAARLLTERDIKAEMIYVDASHEQDDGFNDFMSYWHLMKDKGSFLADDLNGGFPGLTKAWNRFIETMKLNYTMHGEKAWVMK